MKVSFSLSFLLVVFFGATVLAQSNDAPITVSGRVLTEDGQPVPEASVYLAPENRTAIGRPASVTTDEAGIFKLNVKEPGLQNGGGLRGRRLRF